MAKAKRKTTMVKRILSFDKIALILGFVVDSITLALILLSIDVGSGEFTVPSFISPWLAFSIWVLAVYTYLAFLHSYWEKHQADQNLSQRFRDFLLFDLILKFHNPLLSAPAIISIMTLFWIASYEPAIIGIIVVVAILSVIDAMITFGLSVVSGSASEESKERVEDNWEYLKERIGHRLSRQQWISYNDLKDVAVIWDVPVHNMNYVLAKYATEHPTQTAYAEVRLRGDGAVISGDDPVLINLEKLDHDKYYY
jgi:hypothetical protein